MWKIDLDISVTYFLAMSTTFQLTSTGSSVLSANFYPPIELDIKKQYGLGLIGFYSYHSIKNISEKNNVIGLEVISPNDGRRVLKEIFIPPGAYEIDEINRCIQTYLWKIINPDIKPEKQSEVDDLFNLVANNNTLKCEIKSSFVVRFDGANSLGALLGFDNAMYPAFVTNESTMPVNIMNFGLIRLDCNIISGSFINGKEAHTLFSFNLDVEPGYKLVKEPHNIIYLPVIPPGRQYIDNITIQVVADSGALIDFGGETINIIVELKAIN